MTRDPMAPATEAFAEAVAQFRRETEQTREGWNDEARRKFDTEYGNRLLDESNAAVRAMTELRAEMRQAMMELG